MKMNSTNNLFITTSSIANNNLLKKKQFPLRNSPGLISSILYLQVDQGRKNIDFI